MITLSSPSDYVFIFTITAVAGMFGGLAAELLLNRGGQTGTFELPARSEGLFDFGGFASLLVGAVVGVAILIVFPPETTIVTNAADGTTTSFRGYDVVRLVVTSLVAGSAGGSVLSGLQARVNAAVSESQVQLTAETAQRQLDQISDAVTQVAAARRAAGAPGGGGARPRGVTDPALADVPPNAASDAAFAELEATLQRQVDQAKAAISTVAAQKRR